MRVGLVVLILALAGCTGSQSDSDLEVGASILAADRLPPEAEGGWYLIASELPDRFGDGLVGDEVLSLGIVVGDADVPETAGRLSVGFGCSGYGGGVVSFDPVEFTLNSVAGVGGCQERDRAAKAVIEQIEGGFVEFRDDHLIIYLDGEAIQLRRSAGVLTSEDGPMGQPLVFDEVRSWRRWQKPRLDGLTLPSMTIKSTSPNQATIG